MDAILSSIYMPATVIAGIYGMNESTRHLGSIQINPSQHERLWHCDFAVPTTGYYEYHALFPTITLELERGDLISSRKFR